MKTGNLFTALFLVFCIAASANAQELKSGAPGMNEFDANDPGESTLLERAYLIAPPMVSHNVEDLEITRDNNDCISCHLEGDELDEGHVATKIPASHYVNEYSGEKSEETVVGIRYNCLQCHVPQANAPFPYKKLKK